MPKKKKRSAATDQSYSIDALLELADTNAVDIAEGESVAIPALMDDDEKQLAQFLEFLANESLATFDDHAIAREETVTKNSQVEVDGSDSLPALEEAEPLPPFSSSAADTSRFTVPPAPLVETLASVIASSPPAVAPDCYSAESSRADLPPASASSLPTSSSSVKKIKLVLKRTHDHEKAESVSTTSLASAVALPTSPILRLRIAASAKLGSDTDSLLGVKRKRDEGAADFDTALVETWLAKLKTYGFIDAEIEKLQQHPMGNKNILAVTKAYGWLRKYGFNHEQINALGTLSGPRAIMVIISKQAELMEYFTHAQMVRIMSRPEGINGIDEVIKFAKGSIKTSGAASTSLTFAAMAKSSGAASMLEHEN